MVRTNSFHQLSFLKTSNLLDFMTGSVNPNRISVLLADDDTLMHDMVSHALDPTVFDVQHVETGIEAIEVFRQKRPDLILLDVKMPQMDGYEACSKLRALDPEGTVPIIMITGLDDIKSIERSYHSGADDFITKPITWPTLSHRLAYLHRGNQAVQRVKAQIRSEQTLYDAIPDSIVIFDALFNVKKLHQGKQHYLFTDLRQNNVQLNELRHCAVITMLIEYMELMAGESERSVLKNDFINQISIGEEQFYLECRKAQLDDDEIVLVIRDITQRKLDEEKILNLVLYDTLTGLPNRKYLEDQLTRDIASGHRRNSQIALLFFNIKGFSKINDTYGLTVGDELIVAIGNRISSQLRDYDLTSRASAPNVSELSRFAGDEFAVVLRDVNYIKDVELVAQRIKDSMNHKFEIQSEEFVADLYIGCSLYPENAADAASLISAADSAMHLNKKDPSLPISFYDVSINASAKRKHLLENKLRQALTSDEFELVVQPKVHLSRPDVLAGEVLLRWHNEELGTVSPAEFIPIAEQSGLIIEISKWVFEQTCEMSKNLQDNYRLDVNLAINISPQMFLTKEDFPSYCQRVLNNLGLNAQQFELEVTEYVLMHHAEETLEKFTELQNMGFSLALDDFGTGYSSLSYLSHFDLDTLKIDRLFVSTLNSERSQKLVRSMMVMAHQLDMKVVAEGVENSEQFAFLQELNCDFVQGYLLAKPMALADFIAFCQEVENQELVSA